jgi:AcrR family transcriptional regulator
MASTRTGATTPRRSSNERREHVLAAAVSEFARDGYHGASTAAIAKSAGISQPYIYALFPNKLDLFLAAYAHVIERVRQRFVEAARGGSDPAERLQLMGEAYVELLESREEILFQLQAYAAGLDPAIQEQVRRGFVDLYEEVRRISGAPHDAITRFMASGMMLNVMAALDLPEEFKPQNPPEE